MFYEVVDERLVVVSSQGMPLSKGVVLQESAAISQWLQEATTPLAVNDMATSQVDHSFVLLPEAESMLWLPVFVAARVCGVLAVFHTHKNAFFGSDVDILDFISAQVASIIELYQRVDEVTVTDFLTGLMSRPYFLERVKEESLRSERYGSPVSLVSLSFKPVNPQDTSLQRIIMPEAAACLKQVVRRSDIIARCGDWRFSAILTETGYQGAEVVREKLETEARRLAKERVGEGTGLEIESGSVCYPETEPDREQFVSQANSECC
jgi:diguanylate cyclase (GGDEF)-like protein